MRPLVAALAALAIVWFSGCGGPAPAVIPVPDPLTPAISIVPAGHPAPNAPPVVSLNVPAIIHAGLAADFVVFGRDPDDHALTGSIDFGDGTPMRSFGRGSAAAEQQHTFTAPGTYTVVAQMRDPRGGLARVEARIEVYARKVLFVQGYGSQSRCPDGGGFATRLEWAPGLFESDLVRVASGADVHYASYSGRWCDGGNGSSAAFAEYESGDTCSGIDDRGGIGERLRAQVEALAPAKVTIVGHSMGGLAAAWLVGSDPAWARRHIASVVTFDSPLSGVPRMNMAVLRLGGACDFDSNSNNDLSDGNVAIVAAAAAAGGIVPFYNMDATEREGVLFIDLRQPVPSERTHLEGEALHWELGTTHNGIWNDAPGDEALGPMVRAVVACAIELVPGWACRVE